jgi:hypothetical protein
VPKPSIWDDIITRCSQSSSNFNDYILRGYRREQLSSYNDGGKLRIASADYFAGVFKEVVKIFGNQLTYVDYEIMSVDEQFRFERDGPYTKQRLDIRHNERVLVDFKFKFNDRVFSGPMYMPYLKNDMFVKDDATINIMHNIAEKVAYKINGGMLISVMRLIIRFWREEHVSFKPVGESITYNETIVTMHAHNKKITGGKKNRLKATPIGYLLAAFGLQNTLLKLGHKSDDIFILDTYSQKYNSTHLHFEPIPGYYMYVVKAKMEDQLFRVLVGTLHYIITRVTPRNIDQINDSDNHYWRVALGIAYESTAVSEPLLYQRACTHLTSFEQYLDPYIKEQLKRSNIACGDIYDLIIEVFNNLAIDLNGGKFDLGSPADLHKKRLSVADSVFYKAVVAVFNCAYKMEKTQKKRRFQGDQIVELSEAGLRKFLRQIQFIAVRKLHDCPAVRYKPHVYGDNWLAAMGADKMRQGRGFNGGSTASKSTICQTVMNSEEFKLHPSYCSVEALQNISGVPCVGGAINAYAQINEHGEFVKTEYAKLADKLLPALK